MWVKNSHHQHLFCVFPKELQRFRRSRREERRRRRGGGREGGRSGGGGHVEGEHVFLTFRMVKGQASDAEDLRLAWVTILAHHGQILLIMLLQKCTFSS